MHYSGRFFFRRLHKKFSSFFLPLHPVRSWNGKDWDERNELSRLYVLTLVQKRKRRLNEHSGIQAFRQASRQAGRQALYHSWHLKKEKTGNGETRRKMIDIQRMDICRVNDMALWGGSPPPLIFFPPSRYMVMCSPPMFS